MKIKTLIVDDEPLAREKLELLVRADPELECAGLHGDGISAVEAIRTVRPDIVFLDIDLPGSSGFEVAQAVPAAERPAIIFVTGHEQHAVRAFEICAQDYLLKPFSGARFSMVVKRAKEAILRGNRDHLATQMTSLLDHLQRLTPSTNAPPVSAPIEADYADLMVIKIDGTLHFISARDLRWAEAQGDFVKLQIAGKTHLVRDTLQSFENRLDPRRFLRIHRSFLVNIAHVRQVRTALYGDYAVIMSDGVKLRLSRSYRGKLNELVSQTPRSWRGVVAGGR